MTAPQTLPVPTASRPLLAALFLALLLAPSAIAAPSPDPSAARAVIERAESVWRRARGLDRSPTSPTSWGPVRAPLARGAAGLDTNDVHWQARFGLPVPDRWIRAMLPYGNLLVVGGAFERIGDLEARGIATWDGNSWATLPGYPGASVYELAPYAGGFLALGMADSGPSLARWDGAAWQLFDLPPEIGEVDDLAVLGDQIAVSYDFYDYADGRAVARVALHGPTGWTQLGGDFDDAVWGLAWYGGELYAGGRFQNVGGVPTSLVARWDGSAWQPVGAGLPTLPFGQVKDLAVVGGELVAGGGFGDPSVPAQLHDFARWDGTRWASLGDGAPTFPNVARLRTIGTDLYAIGHYENGPQPYGIARWDGAAWHVAEDSLRNFVLDVAEFEGDLYAGGTLAVDGSRPAAAFARRVGGQWRSPIMPTSAMHGLVGDGGPAVSGLASLDGTLYAAGRFQFTGGAGGWRRCSTTARWDGHEWTPLGMESWYDSYPTGLAVHGGSLYIAGSFITDALSYRGTVARLDGDHWTFIGNSPDEPFLNTTCIASARGELMVGGAASPPFNGIAAWDGSVWHPVGGGITHGDWISAIAQHGTDVIAAGSFTEMGGTPCANIAAWNPSTGWRSLGSGLNGWVYDVISRNGALYVAGDFRRAGGVSVQGIARWQDGQWSALPPFARLLGWTPYVSALGWFHGHLVASGQGPVDYLSILGSDSTWHALGSGLNRPAAAFVELGSSLFVGGSFSEAGAEPAYGIAEWVEEGGAIPGLPRVSAAPNPFATDVHLRYELAAPATARIEIYDLAGHRVERVFEGSQDAGQQDVVWRPVSAHVKAGVYFARLTVAGESRVVRVIRIQ